MIHVHQVSKIYKLEAGEFYALRQNTLRIEAGEFVAVMGPSGSGKSTLLQLIGGLDLPTSGDVTVGGERLSAMGEKQRTLFRRNKVGFVFQNYQLLPMMTAAENIGLAMAAGGASSAAIKRRVDELLRAVNLDGKGGQFPSQLSGGQQQRVAIARALAMKPQLVLADEPTGNLDGKNGADILRLLARLSREEGLTVVMVTHDRQAAEAADRIIAMRDGEVVKETEGAGTR